MRTQTGTLLAALFGLCLAATAAPAQQPQTFRIGTGGPAGSYYAIGGLLADAISNPPGSRPCDEGGACGAPGVVASAVSSAGSVANVMAVAGGALESGFSQSDVAAWAWGATGLWQGRPPLEGLRAIASLYPESIHLVASAASGVASVADLRGRRVSLDEPGSGTLVATRLILTAHGLSERDMQAHFLPADQAAARLREGAIDAFFFVGGHPAAAIADLAATHPITLVPIDGAGAQSVLAGYPFFTRDRVPAGVYAGVTADTPTLSVRALWVTSAAQPDALIHAVTAAMWSENARALLDRGHPKGRAITLQGALDGVAIPLHPGAARYYREAGILK